MVARLLSTLSVVQTKLHQLEEENSISRRRVRELELELEVCKRDVAKERTRILERDEASVHQREVDNAWAKGKGKARAVDHGASMDEEENGERYREAVEEKKGECVLIYCSSSLMVSCSTRVPDIDSQVAPRASYLRVVLAPGTLDRTAEVA